MCVFVSVCVCSDVVLLHDVCTLNGTLLAVLFYLLLRDVCTLNGTLHVVPVHCMLYLFIHLSDVCIY